MRGVLPISLGVLVIGSVALLSLASPTLAGFNASAPAKVRRIFTQLAFAEGRLVTYHMLEPGPQSIQAFPTGSGTGMLLQFPGCPALRPVLDDSAAPSASDTAAGREVVQFADVDWDGAGLAEDGVHDPDSTLN